MEYNPKKDLILLCNLPRSLSPLSLTGPDDDEHQPLLLTGPNNKGHRGRIPYYVPGYEHVPFAVVTEIGIEPRAVIDIDNNGVWSMSRRSLWAAAFFHTTRVYIVPRSIADAGELPGAPATDLRSAGGACVTAVARDIQADFLETGSTVDTDRGLRLGLELLRAMFSDTSDGAIHWFYFNPGWVAPDGPQGVASLNTSHQSQDV